MPASVSRLVEIAGWAFVATASANLLTQLLGWTGWNLVYVLQSLTLWSGLAAVVLAVAAVVAGRPVLAVASAGIVLCTMLLTESVVFHGEPPSVPVGAPEVTVLFANAYYENESDDAAAVALLERDADLLALVEYTPQMADALRRAGVDERYPYHAGGATFTRDGVVLFSKLPLGEGAHTTIGNVPGIDTSIAVGGRSLRLIVVHPLTAISRGDVDSWNEDLGTIDDLMADSRAADPPVPTLVVGDFNATRWHPPFRDLLGDGVHDVHEWLGHGFSNSWPIDGWFPAFVRIDHALVTGGAVPTSVTDVDTPGSDHRGFVVDVAIV